MSEFSKDKLLEFLTYLGDKGMMNLATVQSRKAATNTLLGILEPTELEDVRKLDLDRVSQRFQNLRGTDFKPESVKVYRSRVKSAIDDFTRWKADHANFKVATAPKQPSATKPKEATRGGKVNHSTPEDYSSVGVTFPVPIRPDVVVKIVGLPSDLTKAEATRISNVIQALVHVSD